MKKRKALRASFVVTFAAGAAAGTAAVGAAGCQFSTTNPPACTDDCPDYTCPEQMPTAGAPCDGQTGCGYGSDECGNPIEFSCNDVAEWEQTPIATCNPPPPCEVLGQDGCALDPMCVWHEPGCGDPASIPALPMAGCFSATPCATDGDCPVGTCQQVMVLPACAPDCDSCGEAVFLCVQ